MPIRTLIVDDNPEFIEAAIRFLSLDPHIEMLASAHTGQEALEKARALSPDLVLIDLAMPGMNGLETTRQLKASENPPRVIILTLHDNLEYRQASNDVGADAFITKSEFGAQLLPLIVEMFDLQTIPRT